MQEGIYPYNDPLLRLRIWSCLMLGKLLNLELFRNTSLVIEPFPYLITPGFINKDELAKIHEDYPAVPGPGSYPLDLFHMEKLFKN